MGLPEHQHHNYEGAHGDGEDISDKDLYIEQARPTAISSR